VLETKAGDLSGSMVAHLRWHLNAVFKLAVSDGLIGHNPAQELRVPKDCRPGRARRPLTTEEVNQYLGVLDLPERLMARLAIFASGDPGFSEGNDRRNLWGRAFAPRLETVGLEWRVTLRKHGRPGWTRTNDPQLRRLRLFWK
jgi:hypothetical protein